jgi:hypothetical protein
MKCKWAKEELAKKIKQANKEAELDKCKEKSGK